MNVILIGYRGTGKSSIGRQLAARLQRPFVDADEVLEQRVGCSIADYFAREGEQAFRDRESEILAELVTATNCVISLGGGAILRPQNRQAIRQGGLVVWLQADPGTIASRLHADATTAARRPALTHHDPLTEIRTLLEQRRPLYAECAGHTIDTEQKSLDDCVDEIVCLLNHPSRMKS